ncbi:hypothetical protein D3C77_674890 [compost metagenome]
MPGVLAAFTGDHQVVHVGAAVGVDLTHVQRGLARRHPRFGLLYDHLIVGRVDTQ